MKKIELGLQRQVNTLQTQKLENEKNLLEYHKETPVLLDFTYLLNLNYKINCNYRKEEVLNEKINYWILLILWIIEILSSLPPQS